MARQDHAKSPLVALLSAVSSGSLATLLGKDGCKNDAKKTLSSGAFPSLLCADARNNDENDEKKALSPDAFPSLFRARTSLYQSFAAPPSGHRRSTDSTPSVQIPCIANLCVADPHLTNPHLADPHLSNPRMANPRMANPRIANPRRAKIIAFPCTAEPPCSDSELPTPACKSFLPQSPLPASVPSPTLLPTPVLAHRGRTILSWKPSA